MQSNQSQDIITFLIITKNIELNKGVDVFYKVIEQASLLSKNFLIINNNSEDSTEAIIKDCEEKYKLNLEYYFDNRKEFDYLRYEYSTKVKTEYIFFIDDDEIITQALVEELKSINIKDFDIFYLKLNSYLLDLCFNYGKAPRLFAKEVKILKNTKGVHDVLDNDVLKNPKYKKYYSKECIDHYTSQSVAYFLYKHFNYIEKEMVKLYDKYADKSLLIASLYLLKRNLLYAYSMFWVEGKVYRNIVGFMIFIIYITKTFYQILYVFEYKRKNRIPRYKNTEIVSQKVKHLLPEFLEMYGVTLIAFLGFILLLILMIVLSVFVLLGYLILVPFLRLLRLFNS